MNHRQHNHPDTGGGHSALDCQWGEQPLAVVIGAGDMGMAVARRLGQQHRLLLADISEQRLDAVAERLRGEGSDVAVAVCDVTSPASVHALAQRVAAIGPLRTLAHVAGLSPSLADWRTIMQVNLLGPRLVMDALLPHVSPGAAAIFIASMAAHVMTPTEQVQQVLASHLAPDFIDRLIAAHGGEPTPGLSYSYSKFELIRLCRRQASVWGERKARIVSLSPGMIATSQGRTEFENNLEKLERFRKTPLRRQGNLHEIADAVEFLASGRASFISGIDLLVDGGLSAASCSSQ